jgi:hypothetical protein
MAKLVGKNRHPNIMSHRGIGLCAQTKDNILGPKVNTIARAYLIVYKERESSLPALMTFVSEHQFCNMFCAHLSLKTSQKLNQNMLYKAFLSMCKDVLILC